MVTVIKVNGVFKSDMAKDLSDAISSFESLLKSENCQIVGITQGPVATGLLSCVQTVTIIWTGESTKIQSKYKAVGRTLFPMYF